MNIKKYFVEGIPRRKFLEASLKGGIALAATPSLMMQLLSWLSILKSLTESSRKLWKKAANLPMFTLKTGSPGRF